MEGALPIILISIGIYFALMYWIISIAVKAGNREVLRATRILIYMKAEELKKQGIDPKAAISALNETLDEVHSLKSDKTYSRVSDEEYRQKMDESLL